MSKTKKPTKRQRIKAIEDEIEWYDIRKNIAKAMLELGELGFESCGHGCGLGGEDFSLCGNGLYVNFCDMGNRVLATVSVDDDDDSFEGTIGKAMNLIRKRL